MGISIHSSFPASVNIPGHVRSQGMAPTTTLKSEATSVTLSKTAATRAMADLTETSVEMNAPPEGPQGQNSAMSDRELHALYRTLHRDMDEEEADMLSELLQNLDSTLREKFLTVAGRGEGDLGTLIKEMNRLGGTDQALFGDTALALGNEKETQSLIRATSGLSGEQLSQFLETTHELAVNGNAGDAGAFISAALQNPSQIQELMDKTQELSDSPEQRSQFLNLARNADREVGRLIRVLDQMDDSRQADFLEAAQGAGDGLTSLLDLTQDMAPAKQVELINTLADLAPELRENFLVAADGNQETLAKLTHLSRNLSTEEQAVFFDLAAREDTDQKQLFDIFAALDAPGRSQFLETARTADDRSQEFMDLMEALDGPDRKTVLNVTAKLQFHDLTNFLNGAQPDTAVQVATTANQLDEMDRSYFLYAASQEHTDAKALSELTLKLSGENRENFLFVMANSPEGDARLMDRVAQGTDEELDTYLSRARQDMEKTGKAGVRQTYVFLRGVLDEGIFEKVMDAGTDPQTLMEKLNAMDSTQRENFMDVAANAGTDAMESLVNLTLKLTGTDADRFMETAGTLSGKSLDNFIQAADQTLAQNGADKTRLHKLMDLTQELTDSDQDNFLTAAAGAGKDLNRLVDMTEKLGGSRRSDFLITAAYTAGREVQGRPLMSFFLDTTEKIQAPEEENFVSRLQRLGDHPSQMDLSALHGQLTESTGYYRSAAWLTEQNLSNGNMADWFNSFLGIPMTYMNQ